MADPTSSGSSAQSKNGLRAFLNFPSVVDVLTGSASSKAPESTLDRVDSIAHLVSSQMKLSTASPGAKENLKSQLHNVSSLESGQGSPLRSIKTPLASSKAGVTVLSSTASEKQATSLAEQLGVPDALDLPELDASASNAHPIQVVDSPASDSDVQEDEEEQVDPRDLMQSRTLYSKTFVASSGREIKMSVSQYLRRNEHRTSKHVLRPLITAPTPAGVAARRHMESKRMLAVVDAHLPEQTMVLRYQHLYELLHKACNLTGAADSKAAGIPSVKRWRKNRKVEVTDCGLAVFAFPPKLHQLLHAMTKDKTMHIACRWANGQSSTQACHCSQLHQEVTLRGMSESDDLRPVHVNKHPLSYALPVDLVLTAYMLSEASLFSRTAAPRDFMVDTTMLGSPIVKAYAHRGKVGSSYLVYPEHPHVFFRLCSFLSRVGSEKELKQLAGSAQQLMGGADTRGVVDQTSVEVDEPTSTPWLTTYKISADKTSAALRKLGEPIHRCQQRPVSPEEKWATRLSYMVLCSLTVKDPMSMYDYPTSPFGMRTEFQHHKDGDSENYGSVSLVPKEHSAILYSTALTVICRQFKTLALHVFSVFHPSSHGNIYHACTILKYLCQKFPIALCQALCTDAEVFALFSCMFQCLHEPPVPETLCRVLAVAVAPVPPKTVDKWLVYGSQSHCAQNGAAISSKYPQGDPRCAEYWTGGVASHAVQLDTDSGYGSIAPAVPIKVHLLRKIKRAGLMSHVWKGLCDPNSPESTVQGCAVLLRSVVECVRAHNGLYVFFEDFFHRSAVLNWPVLPFGGVQEGNGTATGGEPKSLWTQLARTLRDQQPSTQKARAMCCHSAQTECADGSFHCHFDSLIAAILNGCGTFHRHRTSQRLACLQVLKRFMESAAQPQCQEVSPLGIAGPGGASASTGATPAVGSTELTLARRRWFLAEQKKLLKHVQRSCGAATLDKHPASYHGVFGLGGVLYTDTSTNPLYRLEPHAVRGVVGAFPWLCEHLANARLYDSRGRWLLTSAEAQGASRRDPVPFSSVSRVRSPSDMSDDAKEDDEIVTVKTPEMNLDGLPTGSPEQQIPDSPSACESKSMFSRAFWNEQEHKEEVNCNSPTARRSGNQHLLSPPGDALASPQNHRDYLFRTPTASVPLAAFTVKKGYSMFRLELLSFVQDFLKGQFHKGIAVSFSAPRIVNGKLAFDAKQVDVCPSLLVPPLLWQHLCDSMFVYHHNTLVLSRTFGLLLLLLRTNPPAAQGINIATGERKSPGVCLSCVRQALSSMKPETHSHHNTLVSRTVFRTVCASQCGMCAHKEPTGAPVSAFPLSVFSIAERLAGSSVTEQLTAAGPWCVNLRALYQCVLSYVLLPPFCDLLSRSLTHWSGLLTQQQKAERKQAVSSRAGFAAGLSPLVGTTRKHAAKRSSQDEQSSVAVAKSPAHRVYDHPSHVTVTGERAAEWLTENSLRAHLYLILSHVRLLCQYCMSAGGWDCHQPFRWDRAQMWTAMSALANASEHADSGIQVLHSALTNFLRSPNRQRRFLTGKNGSEFDRINQAVERATMVPAGSLIRFFLEATVFVDNAKQATSRATLDCEHGNSPSQDCVNCVRRTRAAGSKHRPSSQWVSVQDKSQRNLLHHTIADLTAVFAALLPESAPAQQRVCAARSLIYQHQVRWDGLFPTMTGFSAQQLRELRQAVAPFCGGGKWRGVVTDDPEVPVDAQVHRHWSDQQYVLRSCQLAPTRGPASCQFDLFAQYRADRPCTADSMMCVPQLPFFARVLSRHSVYALALPQLRLTSMQDAKCLPPSLEVKKGHSYQMGSQVFTINSAEDHKQWLLRSGFWMREKDAHLSEALPPNSIYFTQQEYNGVAGRRAFQQHVLGHMSVEYPYFLNSMIGLQSPFAQRLGYSHPFLAQADPTVSPNVPERVRVDYDQGERECTEWENELSAFSETILGPDGDSPGPEEVVTVPKQWRAARTLFQAVNRVADALGGHVHVPRAFEYSKESLACVLTDFDDEEEIEL